MRTIVVRALAVVAALGAAAFALPGVAGGELVRFVDGRYLEIREHAVHGEAIRMTIEAGGTLVFAADRVEWIERGGLRVLGNGPAETAAATRARDGREAPRRASSPSRAADAREPVVRTVALDFPDERRSGPRPIR